MATAVARPRGTNAQNAPKKKSDELTLITIRAESDVEAKEFFSGMRGSKQIFDVEHIRICSIHLNEKSARSRLSILFSSLASHFSRSSSSAGL